MHALRVHPSFGRHKRVILGERNWTENLFKGNIILDYCLFAKTTVNLVSILKLSNSKLDICVHKDKLCKSKKYFQILSKVGRK